MKVAIYGRVINEETIKFTKQLIELLIDNDVKIIIEDDFNKNLNLNYKLDTFDENEGLDKSTDLLFTLGGDGTILRVVTYVKDLEIPIVGINTGRLGFMATINKEEIEKRINQICKEDYTIENRALLELKTSEPFEGIEFNYALNEIAVNRKEATSMVTIDAYLNGEFLNSYWGDGLLVATPTGSTGYSLSCGGPIIMPGSNNLVLTPIAPHNLFARPFVLPDDTEIDLVISGRADSYSLSLDSRLISVPEGIKLNIKKANFSVKMVRFDDDKFLKTLRKKMLWGLDYRNS